MRTDGMDARGSSLENLVGLTRSLLDKSSQVSSMALSQPPRSTTGPIEPTSQSVLEQLILEAVT